MPAANKPKTKPSKRLSKTSSRLLHRKISTRSTLISLIAVVLVVGVVLAKVVPIYSSRADAPRSDCNDITPFPDCLNVSQGRHVAGTRVVGWKLDFDDNEYFYKQDIRRCNGAAVTQTCPFTFGSGLNGRYIGNEIFQLVDGHNPKLCLGTDGTENAYNGVLTGCNNPATGSGGGVGTIFVLNTHSGTNSFVENVYFSNLFFIHGVGHAAWLCDYSAPPNGSSTPLTLAGASGTNKACQWFLE